MRALALAPFLLLLGVSSAAAQGPDTLRRDKTFLVRRDLAIAGMAFGAAGLLSRWDTDIARASQQPRYQDSSTHRLALRISKVNESTLTVAGIALYGIGRLTKQRALTDVALHATESVILASLASQAIRGPLGRSRPYVTSDSDQYDFRFLGGFKRGKPGFERRAFPSIHTSSSMAVATVLAMELKRRDVRGAAIAAPFIYAAGMLPGIARINLDQHWASDIAAGAFMGVFTAYKVVSYSHAHPDNAFDRVLLKATIVPDPAGGLRIGFSPEF
ncbi:MAG: phosphoesterase PA-phosphatase related protein [Gemmatimonadetes bacterium]|nr:phosphoesterase PA-phosphatase related protein [Gemmatimonadota bacterium]